MKRLGIDFGTSYIKCSDAQKEELLTLDKKAGGESLSKIANIITYCKDGLMKIGSPSKKVKSTEVTETVSINNIKMKLIDKSWNQLIPNGKNVSAADVTNDIFKSLYEMLHERNKNEDDYRVTVTTPVCFSERQREIVKRAANFAGFKVENVITEPFASLFYLMRDNLDEDHNVLIVDIGGGTLDICLVKITSSGEKCEIKTESTVGINFGGIIINNQIIDEILLPKYSDKIYNILNKPDNLNESAYNRHELLLAIDDWKEEVFTGEGDEDIDEEYSIFYEPWNDSFLELKLSISELYGMFDKNNVANTIFELLENVIDDSSLICENITDVFLTGGSSLIPYFKNTVKNYFENNGVDDTDSLFDLFNDLDYEEQSVGAVALGAGIFNIINSEDENEYIIKDKIPFTIFTKNDSGKQITKLMADCSYKSYRSLEGIVSSKHIQDKQIEVFQKMPDETGADIYIGYISLENITIENCKYFKLGIDSDRKVFAEFGNIEGNKNNAEFISSGIKNYLIIDI